VRGEEAEQSVAEKKDSLIQVLYTFFDRRLPEQAWERHLCKLPKETQTRILRYRRWEDRQAGVFGKLLLMEGLKGFGYTPNVLSWIGSDGYGRPLIDCPLDFNLSHSGEYVVCAVSEGVRVGIDIEKRKAFSFMDLADCFSAEEWEEMAKSQSREATFYDFWTIKESVLKADGRGLSIPMSQVLTENGRARLNGATWYFMKLDFGANYSCHLATSIEVPALAIEKIDFDSDVGSPAIIDLEAQDGNALRHEHAAITQNAC
jgi:4'-phosphopantetheinyl transferase